MKDLLLASYMIWWGEILANHLPQRIGGKIFDQFCSMLLINIALNIGGKIILMY